MATIEISQNESSILIQALDIAIKQLGLQASEVYGVLARKLSTPFQQPTPPVEQKAPEVPKNG